MASACSLSLSGIFDVPLFSPAQGCLLPTWHLLSDVPGRATATTMSPHKFSPPPSIPHAQSEPCYCLTVALLDLPIQPTTEVLGFGLGSSTSTQHLPFRFYDQGRRGSSDPTVQRSVFASVDKVPGEPAPCPAPQLVRHGGRSRAFSLWSLCELPFLSQKPSRLAALAS